MSATVDHIFSTNYSDNEDELGNMTMNQEIKINRGFACLLLASIAFG